MQLSTIAAQLYTLREYTQSAEGLRTAFSKLQDIGYRAVQISGIGKVDPVLVKQFADDAGLAICATHVPWHRLVNERDELAAEHQLWDCTYVGLGSMPQEFRQTAEGYRRFAEQASQIAKELQSRHGLQLIYHNHDFEFERVEGRMNGMELLLKETDPQYFGFELDMYWVQAGGGSPLDWAYRVQGRMPVVHLKDMAMTGGNRVFAEIGEGNMDYRAIIRACRDTGVEWFVVEQDECRRDPFESLANSFRYLEGLLT